MPPRKSAAPAAPKTYIVTNDIPGRVLTLDNNRRLEYGDSAEVSKEVYDIIEKLGG